MNLAIARLLSKTFLASLILLAGAHAARAASVRRIDVAALRQAFKAHIGTPSVPAAMGWNQALTHLEELHQNGDRTVLESVQSCVQQAFEDRFGSDFAHRIINNFPDLFLGDTGPASFSSIFSRQDLVALSKIADSPNLQKMLRPSQMHLINTYKMLPLHLRLGTFGARLKEDPASTLKSIFGP